MRWKETVLAAAGPKGAVLENVTVWGGAPQALGHHHRARAFDHRPACHIKHALVSFIDEVAGQRNCEVGEASLV